MSQHYSYYPERGHMPHASMHRGVIPELRLGEPGEAPVIGASCLSDVDHAAYLRALAEQALWLADRIEGHHEQDEGPACPAAANAGI